MLRNLNEGNATVAGETIKVKAGNAGEGSIRISVDAAGEEARGVTVDAREHIMQVASESGLQVSFGGDQAENQPAEQPADPNQPADAGTGTDAAPADPATDPQAEPAPAEDGEKTGAVEGEK